MRLDAGHSYSQASTDLHSGNLKMQLTPDYREFIVSPD